jgi:hypothetical protein
MCLVAGLFASAAHAMVPPSERAVLDAIYYGTGGIPPGGGARTWINITGWGLPPFLGISECDSYGVTCIMVQGQEHVSAIELDDNGLTGQLPTSFSDLPYLETFSANGNDIGGSIPQLSGLTKLTYFSAYENQLVGVIPSLAGLTALERFDVDVNQLTGTIPPLTGLTNLKVFSVYYNQLTGPIPSLSGLPNLQAFAAFNNQLTGTLPAIAGMASLSYFDVGSNRLTGTIPSLDGLPNLWWFGVWHNQLTGTIPTLSDLVSFDIVFDVSANRLTGNVPPAPINLSKAGLCPNLLTIASQPAIDPAWNTATGSDPWWATPFSTNQCDELLYGDFEFIGGF